MRGITRIELVLIGALLVAAAVLVLPELQRARVTDAQRPEYTCRSNLHSLGLGLHFYHDDYGCFPPTWVAGEDGTTRHSWRVLLLPDLDEQQLYDQYRFDQPWDGESNRALAAQLWNSYAFHACPGNGVEAARRGLTSYLAVVGPHTAWHGDQPVSLDEITDRKDQTILLVEVAKSNVNWFEPRDLKWGEMSFRINDPNSLSPGSPHTREFWFGGDTPYVNVLMVDGSAQKLPADTPPETLKALLTIDGGETIDDPFLP